MDTVAIGILVTVLVAAVFFLLQMRVNRPWLVWSGTGAGSFQGLGPDLMVTTIQIRNQASFLGFNVNRGDVRIAWARLTYPSGRAAGPNLKWIGQGGTLEQKISIESGKQSKLAVFGKERWNQDYFILSANDLKAPLHSQTSRYDSARKEFILVIADEINRQYRFKFKALNREQSVSAVPRITLNRRYWHLREAIREFKKAIMPVRFEEW